MSQLYLSCQRYKSKAIHNSNHNQIDVQVAVFIMSKIQIESNSQHERCDIAAEISCIYHVKDTNRKQFTTDLETLSYFQVLYLSCQRYKSKAIHNKYFFVALFIVAVFIMSKIQIESNSQHSFGVSKRNNCCIYHVKDTNRKQFTTTRRNTWRNAELYLSCQRYKSKAIHNYSAGGVVTISAVFIMSKIQIESNSQLILVYAKNKSCCIYHVKDTNRKQFTTDNIPDSYNPVLYLSCQRYKSKAIHNLRMCPLKKVSAVFIMSKIQIESNSQLIRWWIGGLICCIYHVKDTNRKQFTTDYDGRYRRGKLYLSCQRYKSKAIHNTFNIVPSTCCAVFIMSKIQIESNSQPE